MTMDQLFFELIRISIGNASCFSHSPSEKEWESLYEMSRRQALLGICFVGVNNLLKQNQCPPRRLYVKWMGLAKNIEQKNYELNKKCVSLYTRLSDEGWKCCILKGQGIARYYGTALQGKRQAGDIDVLVDGDDIEVLKYAATMEKLPLEASYKHVHMHFFMDTAVDLHYRMSMSCNLWRNRRLQRWNRDVRQKDFVLINSLGFAELPLQDNVLFLIHHTMWHFLFEGVGFRQVMDLYFLLKARSNDISREYVCKMIKELSMQRFTGALMWVIASVFEQEKEFSKDSWWVDYPWMLCAPDEKQGRFLLEEILISGNMGHFDDRRNSQKEVRGIKRISDKIFHYGRLIHNYPVEFLWTPFSALYMRRWSSKIKHLGYK